MAEITELTFKGDWRITVSSRDAGWQQRVVVSNTADGTRHLNGAPGNSMDVYGNNQASWTLQIEHNDGSHGWQPNWLRSSASISGTHHQVVVESEDITTSSSDRDYNDLVITLEKFGMVSQPVPPFAIRPETLQEMPEGVFEASLGRYFMAVRVCNIWTAPWPHSAHVGLTDRCRTWLSAAGVQIIDAWAPEDQAAFGQQVVGGKVRVGALPAWESKMIYFKVDVTNAAVRKHQVEVQVFSDSGPENIFLLSPKAKAPIFVSRTSYDAASHSFISECDVGIMTVNIKELTVDHTTFKRAMGNARKLVAGLNGGDKPPEGKQPEPGRMCSRRRMVLIRHQLQAFLDGKQVDLCAILRELMCCCAHGGISGDPGGPDDPWTNGKDPGLTFFAWPTVFDYTIEYRPGFQGQYGPIPYEDPWWKVLLLIIAIILSIAAGASSVADLANRSDDVVIGTLARSIMNTLSVAPAADPPSTDPGTIDAAVATLNGNRDLTPAVFSLLDAEGGEFYTASPINTLGGRVDTPGTTLSNAQIDTIFQNLANNPTDPAAQAAVRAYKTGARSGVGRGVMSSIIPVYTRHDHDGVTRIFVNQIQFRQDTDTTDGMSCSGDSGSLWFQEGTNAVVALNHGGPSDDSGVRGTGSRIEDVINQINIRFA